MYWPTLATTHASHSRRRFTAVSRSKPSGTTDLPPFGRRYLPRNGEPVIWDRAAGSCRSTRAAGGPPGQPCHASRFSPCCSAESFWPLARRFTIVSFAGALRPQGRVARPLRWPVTYLALAAWSRRSRLQRFASSPFPKRGATFSSQQQGVRTKRRPPFLGWWFF